MVRPEGYHRRKRLRGLWALALIASIRFIWKGLPETNAVDCLTPSSATKKSKFLTSTPTRTWREAGVVLAAVGMRFTSLGLAGSSTKESKSREERSSLNGPFRFAIFHCILENNNPHTKIGTIWMSEFL